ncbi:MAG: hypothetical protein LQ351_006756 [Letrouitia transgressa]|nr:MAG: hypothetical protein LQ351_006756 [Letrouitia transgressa]
MAPSGTPHDLHDDDGDDSDDIDDSLKGLIAEIARQVDGALEEEWPEETSLLPPSAPPAYSTGSNSSRSHQHCGTEIYKGYPDIPPSHADGLLYLWSSRVRKGLTHTEYPNVQKICPVCIYGNITTFTFNRPSEFLFAQELEDVSNHVQTWGEIHVRAANDHAQKKAISVELVTFSSDPSLQGGEVFKREDDALIITLRPISAPAFEEARPCIYIGATIWISRDLTISDLRIATDSLSVEFHDDLHLSVRNAISIRAESGTVKLPSPHIDSPCTNVVSRFGSVEGDFVLRDALSIRTSSGSININVKLQKGTLAKPAVLDVKSNSGSIHVDMPTTASEIPDRDYRVTIEDTSGSIDANVVHGSSTRIKNTSGRISAELYPFGPNTSRSDIYTNGMSGSTDITVHDSLSYPNSPLRKLYASHRGMSGSLSLAYPGQWEGKVEGVTVSGSLSTDWPGLEIIRDHKGFASHQLKAVKGHGEGIIAFHGVSGSVDLRGERGPTGIVGAWQDGEDDTESETGDGVLTPQGGEDEEWEEKVYRGERTTATIVTTATTAE